MLKQNKILGLIPARGGSKGLPRKNIKPLLGKPLIGWTIEQALISEYLDKVVVSTDDEEIAEVSERYGAEVPFLRPKELARDETKSIDVAFHALDFLKKEEYEFEYLALLEPTSPLRKLKDIDKAIEKLVDNEAIADTLVSLGEIVLENPIIAKKVNENGFVVPFHETKGQILRRQDAPKAYFPYGVIYLSKVDALFKYKTFYPERTLPFFIERWQNYEIDDIYDFLAVESILKFKLDKEAF